MNTPPVKNWVASVMQKMYLLPGTVDKSDLELFSERTVTLPEYNLHYAEAGKGETLLFIHGMSNNWLGWIPLTRLLCKSYHVVMLDLPGYGSSSRLQEYSVDIEAEAIARFIKAAELNVKAIIGLSMGSIVIGQFLRNHATLVEKAVLCGPMFRVRDAVWMTKVSNAGFRLIDRTKGASTLLKRMLTTTMASYVITKYINMYRFDRELVDAYGLEGRRLMDQKAFFQMGASVTKNDLEDDLNACPIPVLFIYGEQDKISSAHDAEQRMQSKQGNFTFKAVPQSGHIVTLEKPQEVATSIIEFISG